MSLDISGIPSPQLAIKEVIGTSAKTSNQFSIQDDLIAYTASGGVVVCQLDKATGTMESQRFFCANSNSCVSNGSGVSSANAYLNMAYNEGDNQKDTQRDSFGFYINNDPLVVTGSGISNIYDLEGSSPTVDGDISSPSKLKDRVRSINCIAISPNKKYLAIGESGYQPRILLFSLANDLNSKPFALIYEHSFGVNSITFSSDLKHFCSLGLINDGFINIWKVSPTSISLLASNRCTTVINQVLWHEDFVITLGLRFIKVWKFEDSEPDKVIQKPNVLKGKNVLLGSFINLNFVTASILNSDEILITSNSNQLLLLKLNQDLKLLDLVPPTYPFQNLVVDYENQLIWFESTNQTIRSIEIGQLKPSDELFSSKVPASKVGGVFGTSPTKELTKMYHITKIYNFDSKRLIYLNDCEEIVLFNKESSDIERIIVGSLIKNLAGFKNCFLQDLIVFSKQGKIKVVNGASVNLKTLISFELPSNGLVSNSLTAIDSNGKNLFLGDKFGNIHIVEVLENEKYKVVYQTKAHSSSVNDIVYFEVGNFQLITSISRDRMIQFFFKSKDSNDWDILQTIPIHNGNLTRVQYIDNRIYVCSTDRSISIHKIEIEDDSIKVFQVKVISNKSTPVNFKVYNNELIVSMNDKSLQVYKVNENYELSRSFKLANEKINENLLVENFLINKNYFIASSSDKSLRVFNYLTGRLVSVAWGHLDTILSLTLNSLGELLSIGSDGCIFKWTIGEEAKSELARSSIDSPLSPAIESIPLYTKVTRKIIPSIPLKTTSTKLVAPDEDCEISPVSSAPTPKLTSATLKRLESKRNSLNGSRPSSPSRTNPITRTSARTILPASKPASPFKTGPTYQQSRSVSPVRSPSKRSLVDFDSFRQTKPHVSLDNSTPTKTSTQSPVEKALGQLELVEQTIRSEGSMISKSERDNLRTKVGEIFKLLNGGDLESEVTSKLQELSIKEASAKEDTFLENYSNKLIQLFEKKLEARIPFKHFPHLLMDSNVSTFFENQNNKVNDANDID
jgi:hypothetical protein